MEIIKKNIPKFIKNFINIIFKRKIKLEGSFNNWNEALSNSNGYDNSLIFNKTIKSFEKVIKKEASFERDSVLFHNDLPDKDLISIIRNLYKYNNINICDFGGSLASSYFQNINFLNQKKFIWNVIEQKKYVDYAKKNLHIPNLNFFTNVDFLLKKKIDLVIFSSVLQYLKSPYILLNKITKKKIKNIIICRKPFSDQKETIKIQIVPKHIYSASYPVRIFDNKKLIKYMSDRNYKIKKKFQTNETIDGINYKGYFFIRA